MAQADYNDPNCPDNQCSAVYDIHHNVTGTRCAVGVIDGGGCDQMSNGHCIPVVCYK